MTGIADTGLQQSREKTVLAHLEAEKRRDVDATLATFKVGVARLELPGEEVIDGRSLVVDAYRELFTAFPDRGFPDLEPGQLRHHGDVVIAESRLQGTHLGPFRGLPPTGRRMDVPLVAIFEFDGPDLLCERVYYDRLTLFIQLGIARDPNTRAGKITTLLNNPVTLARAAFGRRGFRRGSAVQDLEANGHDLYSLRSSSRKGSVEHLEYLFHRQRERRPGLCRRSR